MREEPELESYLMAEFVGIMLGDGCVGEYECKSGDRISKQYCVKVTLSSEEQEYSDYIESVFLDIFSVEPSIHFRKNENVCEVRCFQKELFDYVVEEIGLIKSPKWDRAKIPERYLVPEFRKHVLRGYFDTDGSVVLTDNNGTLYPRLEMKISPSPMQQQFVQILDQLGFNFGVYEIGKGKVRIQMNGKTQLNKFKEEIGFKNDKHIQKAEKVC